MATEPRSPLLAAEPAAPTGTALTQELLRRLPSRGPSKSVSSVASSTPLPNSRRDTTDMLPLLSPRSHEQSHEESQRSLRGTHAAAAPSA
eukprot:1362140-Prymnesium_polylepis.1